VKYKGISPKYDEWIHSEKEGNRIKEVGAFSNAAGWAKSSQRYQDELR
jgi:hypothetical protein